MTPSVDGSTGAALYRQPPVQDIGAWSSRSLNKGEVLYRAGDRGGSVYRVDEGLLKLILDTAGGRERILLLAGPGDLIGTLTGSSAGYSESAEALSEEAVVSSIPRDELPLAAAERLLEAAARRVETLYDTIADSERPVLVRLARTLARLGSRFGQRAEGGTLRLTVPLTHEQLAAMIGSARETTSTALGELRSAGAISGTRGRYLLDPRRLDELLDQAA